MSEQDQTSPAAPALQRVPKAAQRGAKTAAATAAAPPPAPDGAQMPKPRPGSVSQDDERRPGYVRQPFGTVSLKLSAPKRQGFHRHWFNDVLNRIEQAKAAGYAHVCEEGTARPMKRTVGRAREGGALVAYLMEIPVEWFEEDMAAGQRQVDAVEHAIRHGTVSSKEGDERYVPDQGRAIKISE